MPTVPVLGQQFKHPLTQVGTFPEQSQKSVVRWRQGLHILFLIGYNFFFYIYTYLSLLSMVFKGCHKSLQMAALFVAEKGDSTQKYNRGMEVTSLELPAAS